MLESHDLLRVARNDAQGPGYIGPGNCVRISGPKLGNVAHPDIPWIGIRPHTVISMTFGEICEHVDAKYIAWLQNTASGALR